MTTLSTFGLFPAVFGQTNAPAPERLSNRYLIIVETSKAMQPRADGVLSVVNTLVSSGFNNQARPGDSLGVWTYNDQLHAGEFALQTLLRTNRMVAKSVVEFLQSRKYEKQPHLEKVLPQVQRLIQRSDFITVILISDGTQNLEGTPFDDPINKAYKSWEKEQTKAKMPIVTLLRAKKGELTHYAVSPVPWPLEMPPLPEELKLAAAPKRPTPEPPKPAPIGQPLIIIGKKPAPVEATPASTQPPAATTVDSSQTPASPPAAPQTEPAKPELSVTRSTTPAPTTPPVRTEPAPDKPAGEIKTTLAGDRAEPNPQPSSASSAKPVAAQAPPEPAAATPPSEPAAAGGTPPVPDTAQAAPANKPPEAASQLPAPGLQPSAPPAPASAQNATAVPPEGLFSHTGIWIAGLAVLVLGVASWLWLRQRARTVPHESLITRSFDRDKP